MMRVAKRGTRALAVRRGDRSNGRMTQAHDRLLIIDFGSQVTQLIARRLRELNVYCEIHPYQKVTPAFLAEFAPKAVMLSGGPGLGLCRGCALRRRWRSSTWACRCWASAMASR